jgi:fibronectin-binding autotransporter adhesin
MSFAEFPRAREINFNNSQNRSDEKSRYRRRAMISLAAAIALADCASRVHATTQTSTWVGASSNAWSTAANWNPTNVAPNNGSDSISDFDVIINSVTSPDSAPILNTSVTIDNLTLNTGATLGIQGASDLTLNDNVVNDGIITINSNNSNSSTMTFSGGTLSGTGTITLNSGGAGADVAGTLTQSSGHTINGYGDITAALTNNSTVDANVSGQAINLLTSNMTNNSVMEATGGGNLIINAITVTQGTNGQFSASGSIVALDGGATISGGTLNTSSGGVFQATNSSTDTLASVTNDGTFNIIGASDLNITGNLADNGVITVNSNNSNSSTMTFSGGTLSGTGTITLNSGGAGADVAGTLTQSSGHTINGYGDITGALTNNSTVDANVSDQAITLETSNMTNNSVMEATGGGDLVVDGITVTQGTSGQFSASGTSSIVALDGDATISGGTLNTSSGGIFQATNNSSDTLANVTNNGTFNIIGASDLNITGNLADNGVITVNSNNSSSSTMTFSGGTLSGTGTITLNSGGAGADVAGTLTQSSGHTINGFGEISAAFTNNGLVNASATGGTLVVDGATTTNTSTMEATNGVLVFNNNVAVTNTGGTIDAASNDVVLNGASITGGTLKATSPNVILVQGATFNGLTITASSTVDVQGSFNLTLTGSTLTNDGNIALNYNDSNFSTLQVNSNDLLTGSGSLTLDSSGTGAMISTGVGDTLTQDVNHTINGYGEISAVFTNNGTVDASSNGNELILATSSMTNNKLMEATGGGILLISGITVTQGTNGQISASGTNSLVALEAGATISGGTLNTSSGGIFQATSNSTDTLANVTNNGTFNIIGASNLNITGNLVNNGAITVNSNDSNVSTMTFSGGTLSGTGTITLNSGGTNADVAGTLTQSSGQTINGFGGITAALTNNGTVNANVSGQTINLLTSNMTNNSVMEATGGGNLTINGITVTQGASGQISATGTGSSITLIGGATISGGTLNTSAGDVVQAINNSSDTLAHVTSDATVDVQGASNLAITGGLVNNGTLSVDSNTSNFSTVTVTGGAITGTGTITIQSGGLLAFGQSIGGSSQESLSITGSGQLDLNNNHMFIDYGSGSDPIASIAAWIISGYNGGRWNGSGIMSSAAAANSGSYGIGYADSADPGNPAGLASGTIEIKYTLLGDANLDGKVNGADFTILASNFNKSVTDGWDEGDFNYDGKVNGADFTLLANNFNQAATQSDVAAADLTALEDFAAANGISLSNTSVPEPASAAILAMMGLGLMRRRRKAQKS